MGLGLLFLPEQIGLDAFLGVRLHAWLSLNLLGLIGTDARCHNDELDEDFIDELMADA